MALNLTRRSLLAAVPVVGSCAAVPVAALQPPSGIDGMIAKARAALAIQHTYDEQVFTPAHDAWVAARDAVPHHTIAYGFERQGGGFTHLSTKEPANVRLARAILTDAKPGRDDELVTGCREVVEADKDREHKIVALKQVYRIDELEAEYDRLVVASNEAMSAVDNHPVHTAGDLLKKVAFAQETCPDIELPADMILADLRRIAGEA